MGAASFFRFVFAIARSYAIQRFGSRDILFFEAVARLFPLTELAEDGP
jgi:hypothetical protein